MLPGVLFVFAAEARLDVSNESQGDRIFRFLAAAALLNALWLWGTLRFVSYFDDLGLPDWDWDWSNAVVLLAVLVSVIVVSTAAGWLTVRLPLVGRPLSRVILGYRPDELSSWDRIIVEANESANPRVMSYGPRKVAGLLASGRVSTGGDLSHRRSIRTRRHAKYRFRGQYHNR